MKNLKKSGFAKAAAALLCFVSALALIAEAACCVFFYSIDIYSYSREEYASELYNTAAYAYGDCFLREAVSSGKIALPEDHVLYYSINRDLAPFFDTSLCSISVRDKESGALLCTQEVPGEALFTATYEISLLTLRTETDYPDTSADPIDDRLKDDHEWIDYSVTVTLPSSELPGDLACAVLRVALAVWKLRVALYPIALLTAAIFILGFIFLCTAAGHTKKSEEIHLRFPARVPLDLLLCIVAAGFVLPISASAFFLDGANSQLIWPLGITVITLSMLLGVATAIWLPVSFCARVKAGGWWKNTLIYRLCRLLWRMLGGIFGAAARLIHRIPYIWRTLLAASAVAFLGMLLALAREPLLWLPLGAAVIAYAVWFALSVQNLRRAAARLAAGVLDEPPDTKHMPHELGMLGKELCNVRLGLSRAVESKMKSERMKTELITNVSHDLKTPLTSIVNYVELLNAEKLDGNAAEYAQVLARQSARLRKLTDDLVEASKATSGSLTPQFAPVDLSVMAEQAAGEYAERLAARELTLVVTAPQDPAVISADGRLMWRIWDNLFGNICKYAMPGTRVYLTLEERADSMVVTFRNISEQPLKRSGAELTERFVRDDDSRAGEGSGLGLSIASSLAAVQNGKLQVTADGDLFKAELIFKLARSDAARQIDNDR